MKKMDRKEFGGMGYDSQSTTTSSESANYLGESKRPDLPERRCEGEFCRTKLSRDNKSASVGPYLCYASRSRWIQSGSHICEAEVCKIAIIYREEGQESRKQVSPFLCVDHDEKYTADPASVPLKPKVVKSKPKRVRNERVTAAEAAQNDEAAEEAPASDEAKAIADLDTDLSAFDL